MKTVFLKDIPVEAIEAGAFNAKRYQEYKEADRQGFNAALDDMRGLGINETTIDFALGCAVGISLFYAAHQEVNQNGTSSA